MRDVLYIITGTTRGIGHEIKKLLIKNKTDLISLNRKKCDKYDYKVDLSHAEEVSAVSYHLKEKIKSLQSEVRKKSVIEENFNQEIEELSQETENLVSEIDKWQM